MSGRPARYDQANVPQGWRGKYEHLKTYHDWCQQNLPDMTVIERRIHGEEYNQLKGQYTQAISAGAVQEWHDTIRIFQAYQDARRKAETAEVKRFDAGKLSSEMALCGALVGLVNNAPDMSTFGGGPSRADRLNLIYQDAVKSGDLNKQRACYEIFSMMTPPASEGETGSEQARARGIVVGLIGQAKQSLAQLRVTPEMVKAAEEEDAAFKMLMDKRRELEQINGLVDNYDPNSGTLMWSTTPIAKALKEVSVNKAGEVVYNEPEPEPIDFSKLGGAR